MNWTNAFLFVYWIQIEFSSDFRVKRFNFNQLTSNWHYHTGYLAEKKTFIPSNFNFSVDNSRIKMNISDTASEVAYFTSVDYSVLVILLSFSLAIGIYFGFFSQKLKTAEDYLVGGHKMKSFPIAISLVASQLSAISIVAVPAEIYSFGWHYFLVVPTAGLVTIIIIYLFLPVFYHNSIDNCYAVS